jgi:hypothetical protein
MLQPQNAVATRQLTAYVPLAVTTVNWSVNGVIGGNSTVPAPPMRLACKPPAQRIVPNSARSDGRPRVPRTPARPNTTVL